MDRPLRPWASWAPVTGGKGSQPHSGRPLLRMGSDREASREKDMPLCEWHSIRGTSLSQKEQRAPTLLGVEESWPEPIPFHYEGVSRIIGSQEVEHEVMECQGISLFTPQEWYCKLEAFCSCKSYQLHPRMAFPSAGGNGQLLLGIWHSTSNPFLGC